MMRPTRRRTARFLSAITPALALALALAPAGTAAASPAPSFTATIGAEHLAASDAWTNVLAAQPGERLRLLITYANTSAGIEHNALIGIKLPKGATLNGAVTLTNAMHPTGAHVAGSQLIGKGINIGNYGPGADGYLTLFIRMPPLKYDRCGITLLTLPVEERVGAAHHGATLHLHAHNDCPVNMTAVAAPAG